MLAFKWSSINLSDELITKQNVEVVYCGGCRVCAALLFAVDAIMLHLILGGTKYRMFDSLAVRTTTPQK